MARFVPPFASNRWSQFSIKSLMMLTVVVSVLLALLIAYPVSGSSAIAITVLGLPVIMRTRSLNNRYRHASKDLPLGICLGHFMVSAGIYMMITLYGALVGAFLLCFSNIFLSMCVGGLRTPTLVADVLQTSSFAVPFMVSLGFMWFLLRDSWPTEYLPPAPPFADNAIVH